MNIKCNGDENDFLSCYRELAQECTHSQDVIVECSNKNFDKPENPEDGSLRLIGGDNSPSDDGIGRLEFYKGGWGSVCNEKFGDKNAVVACRQMGYDSGTILGLHLNIREKNCEIR